MEIGNVYKQHALSGALTFYMVKSMTRGATKVFHLVVLDEDEYTVTEYINGVFVNHTEFDTDVGFAKSYAKEQHKAFYAQQVKLLNYLEILNDCTHWTH